MALVKQGRDIQRVRVTPKDDVVRASLRHPRRGGFRSVGSIEWPLDTWTKRRIKDGDVIVEKREPVQPVAPQASANPGGARAPQKTGGSGTMRDGNP
jgi:hypothetical protein